MSSEPSNAASSPDLTLEIAHVLFLDVVAYSRLPMEQQAQVLRQLQQMVKETNEFQRAHSRPATFVRPPFCPFAPLRLVLSAVAQVKNKTSRKRHEKMA